MSAQFATTGLRRLLRGVPRPRPVRLLELPANQQGTISILSTFALLMFTMLLLLVTNVAQQLDDKVKMQNAVDAATYSGGVVLARGMNAIAFANHLECDVLAVVAFLREARDRNAEQLVPEVLEHWRLAGEKFTPAQFEKFRPLPTAIPDKADKEQPLVTAWSELAASAAAYALPVFEYILGTPENVPPRTDDHLIPNFQRAILQTIPTYAQEVTNEVALRHGVPAERTTQVGPTVRYNPQSAANNRGPQFGVLWRTRVLPVGIGDESDPMMRTLPVVDPDPSQSDYYAVPNGADYLARSQRERRNLVHHYLNAWVNDDNLMRGLGFFGREAKMSQFQELFRIAACGQINQLLDVEYPTTNVPMMLRRDFGQGWSDNEVLEDDYAFVGVAYRAHVPEMGPRMFSNPLDRAGVDAVTFAQISLYVPRSMYACCPWATPWYDRFGNLHWVVYTNGWPNRWDTFAQNWMVQLTPATAENLPDILQTNPGGYAASVRPPPLGGVTMRDLDAVNTH